MIAMPSLPGGIAHAQKPGAGPSGADTTVESAAPARRGYVHESHAPLITAARAGQSVRVDGRLDDAAWAAATPVTSFTQADPTEGAPVSERTEVRVLYDGDALYVGARLHDRGKPSFRLGRRDMELGDGDWFSVVLDAHHDHRNAVAFLVNSVGVKRDATRGENGSDVTWDAVWDAAVTADSSGWTAELRIPFSQLRFDAARLEQWGVQFERWIGRKNEYAMFAFTPKAERGGVARYAHLQGLRGIAAGNKLEVLPYSVAKAEYVAPGLDPFRRRGQRSAAAGVDLKYKLSSKLTLDATINPDFGQVEVDPAVVNLSDVETFYEERRPFFVEGAQIFRFGSAAIGPSAAASNVFYSRRIGRAPQLGGLVPESDVPTAANILGAAKVSGRTAGGWSLGLLDAVTDREVARSYAADGTVERAGVEPMTNYLVARAGRQLNGGSTDIGAVVTSVSRRLDETRLEGALRSDAQVGGLDFRHEWAQRSWSLSGFLIGSSVRGSAAAMQRTQRSSARYLQRPDRESERLDTTLTHMEGMAAQLQLFKQAGEHWIGDVGVSATTPGYEPNDLGFVGRTDLLNANARLVYVQNKPGAVLRRWDMSVVGVQQRNFDGDRLNTQLQLGGSLQHVSYWSTSGVVAWVPERLDDRFTRGGPLVTRPSTLIGVWGLSSDGRKAVTGSLNLYGERDVAGSWNGSADVSVRLRPSTRWNLTVGPSLQRSTSAAQYVTGTTDSLARATFGGRYVFARLDQTTAALVTRLNVTMSPTLSFQAYAQPFVAHGAFGDPAQLRAARTYAFDAYGRDVGTREAAEGGFTVDPDGPSGPAASFFVPDPDFSLRSLRGNAVLRWEYRPGSTLFVAWQQSRTQDAWSSDFDLGGMTRDLFRARPDNVVMVKLSYWLNL